MTDTLAHPTVPRVTSQSGAHLYLGDFLKISPTWPNPTTIVCDGPYGLNSYPGDLRSAHALPEWYQPHIARITQAAIPSTTLWFWNTELGWANVHPVLEQHGWRHHSTNIWDKGIAHIAGNSNTQTLRRFPVVTEVCVQYVREPVVNRLDGSTVTLQDWLRTEWLRTGLPLNEANQACGVKNAATRKYLTTCDLWYMPPPEVYQQLVHHANQHGDPKGRPYYDAGKSNALDYPRYHRLRSKFHCPIGVTNVWRTPTVHSAHRTPVRNGIPHPNQKPVILIERIINASSDPHDVVWDPFAGVGTTAIAAINTGRRAYASEINPDYWAAAGRRLETVQRRLF